MFAESRNRRLLGCHRLRRPLGPPAGLQRLRPVACGQRTHGRRNQADVRLSGLRWSERQLCEVLLTLPAPALGQHRRHPAGDCCSPGRTHPTDPIPTVRFLQSCPTPNPAISRSATAKQPFVASGSRPVPVVGRRGSRDSKVHKAEVHRTSAPYCLQPFRIER